MGVANVLQDAAKYPQTAAQPEPPMVQKSANPNKSNMLRAYPFDEPGEHVLN